MTNKEAIELLKPLTELRDSNGFGYYPMVSNPVQVEALKLAIEALESERPRGEWIYDNKLCNWKCSECDETPKTIGYCGNREFMTEHFKYCNHCGADMRGGKT